LNATTNFKTLWLSVAAIIAYLAGHYVVGAETVKFFVDALLLGVSVMLCWTWGPAALRALLNGGHGDVAKIVLTIWLAWTALLVQRVYVISMALLGRPQWLLDSPAAGLIATIILIAGCYALLAPSAGGDVPKQEVRNLIIGVALGGVVVGVAVGLLLARGINITF
jgi:hypothetical protein